ncbi:uncharacterized protein ASPGLDRAFT_49607 [Aspergillus glaucus CBS 516.65]|uniref:Uncharacterized protein n=1 Tax=Aspergillus glaucus CBS 516.65 TaxID=1160497 RepID=A0A1L9VE49_ASPGL|nr:hypothetical protein ASPGLDRAFT_49607 [Aspergillus glaucus CBS 516.65]OJJ82190.1 hypothetical protein ASPGLDRAFT_49607 [Aspergillus glaucus CBS 516.65]
MPTDYDGDSQMASSPESGARTPTMTNPPAIHSSELSPPGSQHMERTADLGGFEKGGSAAAAQGKQQKVKPGEWKSKRAEDEAQRAMEFVVDRDFSLKEFGDPFDERDMDKKLP